MYRTRNKGKPDKLYKICKNVPLRLPIFQNFFVYLPNVFGLTYLEKQHQENE